MFDSSHGELIFSIFTHLLPGVDRVFVLGLSASS